MRALGFDVKKAEVQQIMRDYGNEDGLIAERDFVTVGASRRPARERAPLSCLSVCVCLCVWWATKVMRRSGA